MLATFLQVTIPLLYVALGLVGGRLVWQRLREVPAVREAEPKCGYTYAGHVHYEDCYKIITKKRGDNTDATAASALTFFLWPLVTLLAGACWAITWRTPKTSAEKILELRKAEAELKAATERMERAQRTWRDL